MAGLFYTKADKLPDDLKELRTRLWAAYEADPTPIGVWLGLIRAMGFSEPLGAFKQLEEAGVFQEVEVQTYQMNKDA